MPNKVYQARETGLNFRPAGVGSGVDIALNGVPSGQGVLSARNDFGASSRSREFEWKASFTTSPSTVGEKFELYLVPSDGTNADGALGSSAASVTDVNRLRNLPHIGTVEIDRTGAAILVVASGVCEIFSRYASLLVWNGTSEATDAGTAHAVMFTPVPDELQ